MGLARDYIPAFKLGHKLTAAEIAGMVGLAYVGKIWYIDPTNGSDTANGGKKQNDAFATATAAHAAMTTFSHDVAVLVSGGTAGTGETAAVTWSKSYCHLIGNAAPVGISPRARVVSTTDSIDPCFTISGNGNIFQGVQFTTFQASNDVLVALTGDRNYFGGIHFAGIGHTTAGDDSTARCLTLTEAYENEFVGCTFGLDTIERSTTNATIEFATASSRNYFRDSRFIMFDDNAGPVHVLFTGTSAIDRWVEFENAKWYAFSSNNATAVTACFNLSAQTATGHVLMTGRQFLQGITDWEATATGRIAFERYTETANVIGFALNPTVV
jgi:hypothetical protein